MAKRVKKFSKSMLAHRLEVARMFREAKRLAKAGHCERAADWYNTAVSYDRRHRTGVKDNTFWQIKGILHNCRRSRG